MKEVRNGAEKLRCYRFLGRCCVSWALLRESGPPSIDPAVA